MTASLWEWPTWPSNIAWVFAAVMFLPTYLPAQELTSGSEPARAPVNSENQQWHLPSSLQPEFLKASASQSTLSRPAFAQAIDEQVHTLMQSQGIPGMSIAMVVDGELVYANGYGLQNLDKNIQTTSNTLFNLASVSKSLTAVAALRLADMGRLDLLAPVQNYVPTFPEKEWPVSCFSLLTHQSGIRNYQGKEGFSTAPFSDVIAPLEIFQNDPLVHQPGTALLYSSYGYNLLGAAIQGATGQPYLSSMDQLVFRPSDMKNIRVYDGTLDESLQAVGYAKRSGKLTVAPSTNATNKIPSGGFTASAHDMGKFMSALLSGKLLSERTLTGMIRPRNLSNGKLTRWGMGWQVGVWENTSVAGHTGGQPGFSSQIYIIPKKKFGMVVLANLEHIKLLDLVYLSRDEAIKNANGSLD